MRRSSLIAFAFIIGIHCNAQFYKSFFPSGAFTDSLTKVVLDFRFNYKAVQGEALPSQNGAEVYRSKVKLPGAEHCIIYRFHSLEDTTASWQAIMYTGDNYKEAVKIYKNTFRLVKKSQMRWTDRSPISFSGELQEPDESVRFTVSKLKPRLIDMAYRDFYAEVELTGTFDSWEVHLNLHNRRNDMEE